MSPQQAGGDQGHIVEDRGPCSQGCAWSGQAGEGRGLGKPPLLPATTLASLSMEAPGDCPSAEQQAWPHPAPSCVGFPPLPFPSRSSPGPGPATAPVQESLSLVLVLLSRKPGPVFDLGFQTQQSPADTSSLFPSRSSLVSCSFRGSGTHGHDVTLAQNSSTSSLSLAPTPYVPTHSLLLA